MLVWNFFRPAVQYRLLFYTLSQQCHFIATSIKSNVKMPLFSCSSALEDMNWGSSRSKHSVKFPGKHSLPPDNLISWACKAVSLGLCVCVLYKKPPLLDGLGVKIRLIPAIILCFMYHLFFPFISIALCTIQIISKQVYWDKQDNNDSNEAREFNSAV